VTMKPASEIESPRILWVAVLTIFVSVMLVLAVREAAVRILHPSPAFAPLTLGPPVIDTIIAVTLAIFVFITVASYSNSVTLWRWVATGTLLLSFLPDVSLAKSHEMGGGWPEAYALMIMHVVAWSVCVTLLPGLAFSASPSRDHRGSPLSILGTTPNPPR
jgi:hypothetical protein